MVTPFIPLIIQVLEGKQNLLGELNITTQPVSKTYPYCVINLMVEAKEI